MLLVCVYIVGYWGKRVFNAGEGTAAHAVCEAQEVQFPSSTSNRRHSRGGPGAVAVRKGVLQGVGVAGNVTFDIGEDRPEMGVHYLALENFFAGQRCAW